MSQQQLGDILTHDSTKTSKALRTIENNLISDLNHIVTNIRKHINPLQPWYDIAQKFKPIYGQQVYDLIRAGVSDSYSLGGEYVTNLNIFVNVPPYLTQKDILEIEQLTDLYYNKFWGRVVISISRQASKDFGIILRNLNELPNTFLNPNFIVTSIATTLTSHALALGTLRKMRKLADKVNPITVNKNILQAAEPTIENDLLETSDVLAPSITTLAGVVLLNQIINTVSNVKLMWVTSKDERVCPICRPLHGKKWTLFDDNIPIPGPHTHQRCRCRILVLTPMT